MSIELRVYDRLPVRIPVSIYIDGNTKKKFEGEIINISMGGAFVHCVAPIQIGQKVHLEMFFDKAQIVREKKTHTVPASDKVKTSLPELTPEASVVRWVRGSSDTGFGVQFEGLQTDKQSFLGDLIAVMRETRD